VYNLFYALFNHLDFTYNGHDSGANGLPGLWMSYYLVWSKV